MKRYNWLIAVFAGALISSCASMEAPTQTAEQKEDKTSVTGSHIPSKSGGSGVKTMDSQSVQDMQQRGATNVPTAGGR